MSYEQRRNAISDAYSQINDAKKIQTLNALSMSTGFNKYFKKISEFKDEFRKYLRQLYIQNEQKERQRKLLKELTKKLEQKEKKKLVHEELLQRGEKVVNIQFYVFDTLDPSQIFVNHRYLTQREILEYYTNQHEGFDKLDKTLLNQYGEIDVIENIKRFLNTNGSIYQTENTNTAGYINVDKPIIGHPFNTNLYKIHQYIFRTFDNPINKINDLSNFLKNLPYVTYVRPSREAYIRYPNKVAFTRVERKFKNANYQVEGLVDNSLNKPKGYCFPDFMVEQLRGKLQQHTKKPYDKEYFTKVYDSLQIDINSGTSKLDMLKIATIPSCVRSIKLYNSAAINQKTKRIKPVLEEHFSKGTVDIVGVLHGEHIYSFGENGLGIPEINYSEYAIVEKLTLEDFEKHDQKVIFTKKPIDRVFQDLVKSGIIPKVLGHNSKSCEITEMYYKGKIIKYVKEIETSVKILTDLNNYLNENKKKPIEFLGQSPHILLMDALPKLNYYPDSLNPTLYEYIKNEESHQYLPLGWVDKKYIGKIGDVYDIKRCHTGAWCLYPMPQISIRDEFKPFTGENINDLDLYIVIFPKVNETLLKKSFGLLSGESNFYEGYMIKTALEHKYISLEDVKFHLAVKNHKIDFQTVLDIIGSDKTTVNATVGAIKLSDTRQKTLSIYSDCRQELEEMMPDYPESSIEAVRLKYDEFVEVNKEIVFVDEDEALKRGDILLKLTQKKQTYETMTNYRLVHNLITKRACFLLHREINKFVVNPQKNIMGYHCDSIMLIQNDDSVQTQMNLSKRHKKIRIGENVFDHYTIKNIHGIKKAGDLCYEIGKNETYKFNLLIGQKLQNPLDKKVNQNSERNEIIELQKNINKQYTVLKEGEKPIDYFLSHSCLFWAWAGHGKTHYTCKIIKAAIDKQMKVCILCPTHIAKLSLMILFLRQFGDEFINSPFLKIMTIQSALGREESEGDRKIKIAKDINILIVDECFNIQDGLMICLYDVIKSKLQNPTVILSGDNSQLPAVDCEPWDIENDLIKRLTDNRRLEFTTYHRLDSTDPDSLKFYEEIKAVRNGAPINESIYGNRQCDFSLAWRNTTCDLVNFVMINRAIQKGAVLFNNKWFVGMPIISRENKKTYVNSQMFTILEIGEKKTKLLYKEMNTEIEIDTKYLDIHFDPAFCITIASCQGLNIKDAEITLFEMTGDFGDKRPKEIQYTAITRVSKLKQLHLGNFKEIELEASTVEAVNLNVETKTKRKTKKINKPIILDEVNIGELKFNI